MQGDSSISRLPSSVQIKGITTGAIAQSNSNIPPAIAKLSHGSTLSGFVINRDGQGNATLRTDQGDLSIKSELFLKTGSEVLIRIEHSAQQVKANIVTVDGLTLSQLKALQDARAERSDTIMQPSLSPKAPANNTTANTQQVTVNTPPAAGSNANPSAATSLPPATTTATTTSITPPVGNATEAAQLTTSPQAQQAYKAGIILDAVILKPATNAGKVLQQALPQSPASPVTSGATLTIRVSATELPETTLPPQAQLKNAPLPTDSKTTAQHYSSYAKQIGLTLPQQNARNIAVPQTTTTTPSQSAAPQPQTAPTTSSAAGSTNTAPPMPATLTTTGGNISVTNQTIPASPPTNATASANTVQSAVQPTSAAPPTGIPLNVLAAPAPAISTTTPNPAPTANATTAQNSTASAVPSATTPPSSPTPQAANQAISTTQIIPPASSAPVIAPSASNPAGSIDATVIGQERHGEVIVQSSLGTLRLFTATPLPICSKLTLEVLQHSPTPTANPTPPLIPSTPTSPTDILAQLGREWPHFANIMQQLSVVAPATAQNISRNVIPNIGNRFVTATLFFVSALKGGDVRSWIGSKNAQAIEQHLGSEAMQRLSSDFSALRSLFMDRPEVQQQSQQWQTLILPFIAGEQNQQARLYIRDEEAESQHAEHAGGTRFIVELSFSHLGDMQLDGLVRSSEGKALFDLIIRTIRPLEAHIQNDIRAIYNDAASITGTSGQIDFMAAPDALIKPHDDSGNHERHGQGILA